MNNIFIGCSRLQEGVDEAVAVCGPIYYTVEGTKALGCFIHSKKTTKHLSPQDIVKVCVCCGNHKAVYPAEGPAQERNLVPYGKIWISSACSFMRFRLTIEE